MQNSIQVRDIVKVNDGPKAVSLIKIHMSIDFIFHFIKSSLMSVGKLYSVYNYVYFNCPDTGEKQRKRVFFVSCY